MSEDKLVVPPEWCQWGPIDPPSSDQIGGSHYVEMVIQPYEFCYRNKLDYLQSNIIKYVCRFRNKGGKQDLEKAIHTLKVLMEFEYGQDTDS